MKEKSYFLQLEFHTKIIFEDEIVDGGIKVFVPHQIQKKFHKLRTAKGIKFAGSNVKNDIKTIQNKNTDYDIFCLVVSDEFDTYTVFDLCCPDDSIENVVAFVCIPKINLEHQKYDPEYLDGIRVILEDYYNDVNCWDVLVMDTSCLEKPQEYYNYVTDECLVYYDNEKFDKNTEDWFKTCKEKYGISQKNIDEAKNIIKSHKMSCKTLYKIS